MNVDDNTRKVLDDVYAERQRQEKKWGPQEHPDFYDVSTLAEGKEVNDPAALLSKAYGVVHPALAKAACDGAAKDGTITYMHILVEEVAETMEAKDRAELRKELIQVAAVAAAWVEKLDRETEAGIRSWADGGLGHA